MSAGKLGLIVNPASGNRVVPDVEWCGDNAAFAEKYPGNDEYLAWIGKRQAFIDRCRFVTAPDVVGDAQGTLKRSLPMLSRIRLVGFPVALVAQDGIEDLQIPWPEFDALFLGGTTNWKLSEQAHSVCVEARRRGKWVHMGRVNSLRRLRIAVTFGCDSVDGTYLAFGPDKNLPKLLGWLDAIRK